MIFFRQKREGKEEKEDDGVEEDGDKEGGVESEGE